MFLFFFLFFFFFFFNDTATTEIYTLSLHDALPITATACWMPRCCISLCCDVIMSRIANFGNFIRGCALELLGEVVRPFPIASVQMMQYLVGSSALPGPIMKS